MGYAVRKEDGILLIDWKPMFCALADSCINRRDSMQALCWSFFRSMARAGVEMAVYGARRSRCRDIVLSGGLFKNEMLYQSIADALRDAGFRVFSPCEVPVDDAGLCVGQAYYAGGIPA